MKMLIIGYSGAGKTTLANALGAGLGVRVFHVDSAMYDENLEQRDDAKAMEIARSFLRAEPESGWIIDGYSKQCVEEEQLADCDQIVFISLGKWQCFRHALKRDIRSFIHILVKRCVTKGPGQPFSGHGTAASGYRVQRKIPVAAGLQHLRNIIQTEHSPRFEAYYMAFGDRYPEKFTVLHSKKEIDQFLKTQLEHA